MSPVHSPYLTWLQKTPFWKNPGPLGIAPVVLVLRRIFSFFWNLFINPDETSLKYDKIIFLHFQEAEPE
jgi:hypothetical protein